MLEYTIPEIQRTSLTSVILTLKCLGVHDVIRYYLISYMFLWHLMFFYILNYAFSFRFPYLDCPEERFILTALKQLYQYDAIDRWVIFHATDN